MSFLTDTISDISKAGYNSVAQKDTEVRDGIRYCRKCGKPVETIIEHPALGRRALPIMCDCDRLAEQAVKDRLAYEEHDRRRKQCFGAFAGNLITARFDADNGSHPDVTRKCMNYCKNFEQILQYNQGLLFYGSVGTGKSYMASCIANELIDRGYTAYMTTLSDIDRHISGFTREDKAMFIESLMRYSLLILDDLGVERQTEYMQEVAYEVINSRYVSGKPLIITTNLSLDKIKNPSTDYEKRLFDRILDACSYPIQMSGKSQRRASVAEKYRRAEVLLNG